MELPFEKTVTGFWQQKLYTPVMKEETQEVKLPESMPDIGRLIAAWGQVVLRGKEWRGNGMSVTGGVMGWVLYLPEGEAEAEPAAQEAPLPCRWYTMMHTTGRVL